MVAALSKVVTQRRCSLIVERAITYGWNNGMDVTDAVIAAMNAAP
jgi:Skp family chaperone for outer membrane proteins